MNLNRASLLGRITADPRIRNTQTGTVVASFGLATNHIYKNKAGEKIEEVDFHNIVAFGRLAEIIQSYLRKGQLVYVEGRIKTSKYEKSDKTTAYKTEIILSALQLGPGPKTSQGGKQSDKTTYQEAPLEPSGAEEVDPKDIPY